MGSKRFTLALAVAAILLALGGTLGGNGWPGLASVLLTAWVWIRLARS